MEMEVATGDNSSSPEIDEGSHFRLQAERVTRQLHDLGLFRREPVLDAVVDPPLTSILPQGNALQMGCQLNPRQTIWLGALT